MNDCTSIKIIYDGYVEMQKKVKGYQTCCSFDEFCQVIDWLREVNKAIGKKQVKKEA